MSKTIVDTQHYNRRTPAIYTGWAMGGLLLVTGFLALASILPGLSPNAWPHIMTAALLILFGSEAFYNTRRERRRLNIERDFPGFLRALATNHAAGLTLAASIRDAGDSEYGVLTPEIRRMRTQLEFNAPLDDVLASFAARAESPLVTRSVALLRDAMRAGNSTTKALNAAATDATRIQELADVRSAQLSQYTAIVYVGFAVFVMVVFVLGRFFVATVFGAAADPNAAQVSAVLSDPGLAESFDSLFIWSVTVVAAGGGFVIGALMRGRPLSGLQHSFAMMAMGYVVTALAVFL